MQRGTENRYDQALTLVLAANGKTGRRVTSQLQTLGVPVRLGSRSTELPFDWEDSSTWESVLEGVKAAYVVYTPDLSVPSAYGAIHSFTELAIKQGVKRLVLLSGRGEEEAQRCEKIIQESGIEWTIVRASWFCQNFSEGPFLDLILNGVVALPTGGVSEPFIDVDDIADVVVAALTQRGHNQQVYEVTGPSSITFEQAVEEIAIASGRKIEFHEISHDHFVTGLEQDGLPREYIDLLSYLFQTILDGRNTSVSDGVEMALGRAAKRFSMYAQKAAATGVWRELV